MTDTDIYTNSSRCCCSIRSSARDFTPDFTTGFTTGFTTAGFRYGVERLAGVRRARDVVRSSGKKPALVSRVCVCGGRRGRISLLKKNTNAQETLFAPVVKSLQCCHVSVCVVAGAGVFLC